VLFLVGYLLSLLLIWIALAAIGRRMYSSVWMTLALAAAFTLRHRIPRTSANSFEPYFHPRMLAFAVGALAIAALLRRRRGLAVALVAVSGFIHVTTGLWFVVLIGTAIVALDRGMRKPALAGIGAAIVLLAWAATAGPLQNAFTTMDPTWLSVVANKDSLFASDWPVWAWAINLTLIVVAWTTHLARRRQRTATIEEYALVCGATALVLLFLVTLPLVLMKVAFPVQLQISRVFWLVEFVALISIVGLGRTDRVASTVAVVLILLSVGRGAYVMAVEHPERTLVAVHLPVSDWDDAMRWIRQQPIDTHVLADPGHAWKYGTSVRVSAERDVFLEEVKDSAMAIYSRDVALRYAERATAAGEFSTMTAGRVRDLANRYGLDYFVAEADLPLPIAYRNRRFKVYELRP
jgi:hypothetical protein